MIDTISTLESTALLLTQKINLFATEICFLEYIILSKSIWADPAKINKILDWPTPRLLSNIWRFLSLVQCLATFIFYIAKHTSVLDILTKKTLDQNFPEWISEYQKAFEAIKHIIINAESLTSINYNLKENIYITTNASLIETRAILSVGKTWKKFWLVALDFSKYKIVEHNYPVYKQEILIIIWALKK